MKRLLRAAQIAVATMLAVFGLMTESDAAPGDSGPTAAEVKAVVAKAVAYLKSKQSADGSYSQKLAGPGVSAIVAAGMLRNGYGEGDPVLGRVLAYMASRAKPDGGIYDKRMANYTTSCALMAFQEANATGKYDAIIKSAAEFLKRLQHGGDKGDVMFGGAGYDAKSRPDLSNTHFFLDALLAAGVPKDDPAVQKALVFVSRCQNLPGETNDQPFAKKATPADQGGLIYTPIDADDSPHKTPEGGLRSVGAMTYAGLKSFLYAGVSKDDPRVKGAVKWIRSHYSLAENPGMGRAGLFYYYHTFAKAMTALGEDQFTDAKGTKHDWRKELFETLKKQQRPDGSFVNPGERTFGESDPNLATGFALLALSYCQPKDR